MANIKYKVTFTVEVYEREATPETAEILKGNLTSFEGWQIFGEDDGLGDSIISDIVVKEI